MHLDKKLFLFLFVFFCSFAFVSAAYSTSKFGNVNISGTLVVNKSINTTNGDICITGGNCLSGITVVASNTSNVAWENITSFPDSCAEGTFVTGVGGALTCSPVSSDSAYQWLQNFSSTNYVNITDNVDYSKNTTGEITYNIWINPDTFNFPGTGQGYVNYFSKTYYNSSDDDHFEMLFRMYNNSAVDSGSRSRRLSCYVFAQNTSLGVGSYYQNAADTNISAGNWINVGCVVNGTATKIYVNGILRDTDTYSTTIQPVHTIAPLQIGAQPDNGVPNNYFSGKIDELRIYNRSLSGSEMLELYNSGRVVNDSLVPTGLVFWLPMNETSGSPADASPKQHTGINNQGATWGFDGSASSIDWTTIANYPLSCPANSYVSQLGDSLTCVSLFNLSINNLTISNTNIGGLNQSINIRATGNSSTSTSTGGTIFIDNTQNSGAAIILYSNQGANAAGRLMNIRADNSAFDQSAFNVNYAGTVDALTVSRTGNASTGEAADFASTNANYSSVGISGYEFDHGTLKITHNYPGVDDSDAAALSMNINGNATKAQGLYIYSDGNTTGNLLSLNNNGSRWLYIDYMGRVVSINSANFANITNQGNLTQNGNISFLSAGLYGVRNVRSIDSIASNSMFFRSSGTLGQWFFQNPSGGTIFSILNSSVTTGANVNLTVGGNLTVRGKITSDNSSAWASQVVCYDTGGTLGHCTSVVGVGGACTCVTN